MPDFIGYGRQSISEEDIQAVVEVLRGNWLTQGPSVRAFEEDLAKYCGARYAVACANGTAALHLACLAAGIAPKDEVITSAVTFLSSSNCACFVGATPVFSDIDPKTGNLTPESLQPHLSEKTRAVIPVHFAGQSCDMKTISEMVDREAVTLIEDACHAIGGSYRGKKIGCCEYSDMAVFSFHPVKHLTTGEGGAILTNREDLYKKLCIYRTHGMTKDPELLEKNDGPWYYEMHGLGYNYRITDFQCALGASQLKKLDDFIARRQAFASRYREDLGDIPHVAFLEDAPEISNAHHLFVLLIDYKALGKTRAEVMKALLEEGIGTQVHYYPVPLQPYYRNHYGFEKGSFPNAELYYDKTLSIPMFPSLSEDEYKRVIVAIHKVLKK